LDEGQDEPVSIQENFKPQTSVPNVLKDSSNNPHVIQFNKEFQNMIDKTLLRLNDAKQHILKYYQPEQLTEALKKEMPQIGVELNCAILRCLNELFKNKPSNQETTAVKNAQKVQQEFQNSKPVETESGNDKLEVMDIKLSNQHRINTPKTVVVVNQDNLPPEIQHMINRMTQQEKLDDSQNQIEQESIQDENENTNIVKNSNKAVQLRSPRAKRERKRIVFQDQDKKYSKPKKNCNILQDAEEENDDEYMSQKASKKLKQMN
jgi:hypothetical protein